MPREVGDPGSPGRAREVPERRGGPRMNRLSFLHQLHTFCALVLVLFSLRHPGSKVQLLTGTHLEQTFPYSFRDHTGDAGRLRKGHVLQHTASCHLSCLLFPPSLLLNNPSASSLLQTNSSFYLICSIWKPTLVITCP